MNKTSKNCMPKEKIAKIIIAGDGAVGKTSIVNSIIDSDIECKDVKMTPGINIETARYELKKDKEVVNLTFWDLGGQKQFRFFQEDFTKQTDIVLLVYDLSRYKSFINIEKEWAQMFNSGNNMLTKRILVGNKDDLKNSIKDQEIEEMAEKLNVPHIKVSALENRNIEKLLELIGSYLECE